MNDTLKDLVKVVAAMTPESRATLKRAVATDFRRIEDNECPKYFPRAWWQENLPAQEREKLKKEVEVIFRRADWLARNR